MKAFSLAMLLILSSAIAGARADDCQLKRIASLDMKIDAAGGMNVPMTIHGTQVYMLVDTGGIYSMLTDETATALGLRLQQYDLTGYKMKMVGGQLIKNYAYADDIMLGGMHAERLDFLVIPSGRLPPETAGTLAPDLLSNYDVDFDMAGAKVNLFSHDHCRGRVVYWTTQPVAVVPMRKNPVSQFKIDITLDGQKLEADIDTGSSRSFMSYEVAKDLFKWADNDPKLKAIEGNSVFRYPFASLSFEGVSVSNPDIILIRDDKIGFDMNNRIILGMGILRHLHTYVAYGESNLYLSAADAH